MVRELSKNKNYIVTEREEDQQKKDPDSGEPMFEEDEKTPIMEKVIKKSVTAECSAGDPAADNEFDKGPQPIRIVDPYDGDLTVDEMVAACDVRLNKEAGITP